MTENLQQPGLYQPHLTALRPVHGRERGALLEGHEGARQDHHLLQEVGHKIMFDIWHNNKQNMYINTN